MPQRRRNAGLSANSCGERGSCANSSASINSKRASRRKGKAPRRFFRKVCRRCKGAVRGAVMLPTPAPPSGACHHPRPQLGKGLQRHDLNSKLQEFELSEIYRVFGNREQALELCEQARAGFEKMNMILGLGYYQRAQGDFALRETRYGDALGHYQAFMTCAKQDNHLWSMAQA